MDPVIRIATLREPTRYRAQPARQCGEPNVFALVTFSVAQGEFSGMNRRTRTNQSRSGYQS